MLQKNQKKNNIKVEIIDDRNILENIMYSSDDNDFIELN